MQPRRRFVTEDMCTAFFGGSKNYHTDTEESAKMGFDDIVVGGPMSVCYVGDMLTRNLGRSLFSGARLAIASWISSGQIWRSASSAAGATSRSASSDGTATPLTLRSRIQPVA